MKDSMNYVSECIETNALHFLNIHKGILKNLKFCKKRIMRITKQLYY